MTGSKFLFEFVKKHQTHASYVILLVLFQAVSFASFSQVQASSPSEQQAASAGIIAIHTYAASKPYADVSSTYKSERANPVSRVVEIHFWEISWFPVALAAGATIMLFFIQQIRMKSFDKKRKTLEEVLKGRNEEILGQKKNLKKQSESLQEFQQQNDLLKKDLAEQTEKAIRSEKGKNSFLTMVSYGVRTPLNGLMGTTSLLNETQLSNEQREYAQTIRSCGDNLLTAINDMFDFAKIESGEIQLDRNEFSLRSCIEDVTEVFTNKAGEENWDLVYNINPGVPDQIIGDPLRLKQVLINLIAGTVKFTQQIEEIYINIRLIKVEGDDCVLGFEVQDTGIGIHYDSAINMFKSQSHADYSETNKYGGTGLGLSNCEKLVRLMGGTIAMESHRGKGSVFSFSINTRISTAQPVESFDIDTLEGKKVLVVNSHINSLTSLTCQLEQWKMVVTAASSGFIAMKILSEFPDFDLIITDLKMPGFDGVQLAQAVKKFHAFLPIILLAPSREELAQNYSTLFSSVIAKPVKHNMLYKHIVNSIHAFETALLEEKSEQVLISPDFAKRYPLRILVAEDNLINQRLAQQILLKLGYKPVTVENGVQVLAETREHEFDIILMDVQMPELNGLETTIEIRHYDKMQPVIIAMTANAMQGDREECINAGMDDYVSKPVKLDEFITTLKKWGAHIGKLRQSKFLAQA